MALKDELRQKMVDFAKTLLQQTRAAKVAWNSTDDGGKFLYAGTSASVTIESFLDRDGDRQSTLSILNSQGVTIDSLQNSWYENESNSYEPEDWNIILDDLFLAARRSAYNVDDAIVSLLADIEKGIQEPLPHEKKPTWSAKSDPWSSDSGYSDEPPF